MERKLSEAQLDTNKMRDVGLSSILNSTVEEVAIGNQSALNNAVYLLPLIQGLPVTEKDGRGKKKNTYTDLAPNMRSRL